MNISGALKEVKLLKNELKRKLKIRKENFFVIIPKKISLQEAKDNPEKFDIIDFLKITDEIRDITKKISDLRERILKTNIITKVEVDGNQLSLSRLKLRVDEGRSELAQLENITERGIFDRRRKIVTSEEEEKEIAQLTDLELETRIKELEKEKFNLENLLELKNANTELIE